MERGTAAHSERRTQRRSRGDGEERKEDGQHEQQPWEEDVVVEEQAGSGNSPVPLVSLLSPQPTPSKQRRVQGHPGEDGGVVVEAAVGRVDVSRRSMRGDSRRRERPPERALRGDEPRNRAERERRTQPPPSTAAAAVDEVKEQHQAADDREESEHNNHTAPPAATSSTAVAWVPPASHPLTSPLSASSSHLHHPPSFVHSTVPAVPSTASFEPDAPLHAMSLNAHTATDTHLTPGQPEPPAAIPHIPTTPAPHGATSHLNRSRTTVHATAARGRRQRRETDKRLARDPPAVRGEALFGNLLPDTLTHHSVLSLAQHLLQDASPLPPTITAASPPTGSANSSLFTCNSVAAYLASHTNSQPRLVPLPPFHPPRHTSPLAPAVSPNHFPPPLSSSTSATSISIHPTASLSYIPSVSPYHFPLWQNQLPAVLSSVLSNSLPLSPHLVALSASAGMDVYQQLCRLYASQLERSGEPHTAVLYLLAVGDVVDAVRLYVRCSMWGDAMLLARTRLARDNKLITQLWSGWGQWSWQESRQQQQQQQRESEDVRHRLVLQAVSCYIAAGEMEKALQSLIKASVIYPSSHSSTAAATPPSSLSDCLVDPYLPLAYDLAVMCYPSVLVSVEVFRWVGEYAAMQEQWDVALEAYGRDQHWAAMQCLVLVERLAAHSLALSAKQQHSNADSLLPLPTLVQQAWATSSLALQPTLPAAYKLLTSFTSFPFVSSAAAASLLSRTRANFAFHLCLSCLASSLSPAASLPALSDAAFVLYRHSFLSSMLLLVDGSLAPRMKELRRSDARGLYALTVFGLLLRAVQSGHRWQRRELVMWGMLQYKDTQQHSASQPASDEDGQLQCRALESASQLLLFSPAAMLATQLHRRHCIRTDLTALHEGTSETGLTDRPTLTGSLQQCDDSIRLLSHQLSIGVSDYSAGDCRSHFPLPIESCLLLLLYARRYCRVGGGVGVSSASVSSLVGQWRRWLSTCSLYIDRSARIAVAAVEGANGSSIGEADTVAVLQECRRLCAARAAVTDSSGGSTHFGCWEALSQYVSVDQYTQYT